jgi:hypothetical protein
MSAWWYLGEVVNWCHVVFMISVLLLGFLWMRPVWLWLIFFGGMLVSWPIFGGCPITILGDYLQSRHGDSFHLSFVNTYGLPLGMTIVLFLIVCGTALAAWLATRATGPLISRALDKKYARDIGLPYSPDNDAGESDASLSRDERR